MKENNIMVSESFFSIQGEGPSVGLPSLFLRLTSCNLTCNAWPCDSIDVWKKGKNFSFENLYNEWLKEGWIDKLLKGAHLILSINGKECVPVLKDNFLVYVPIKNLWEEFQKVKKIKNIEIQIPTQKLKVLSFDKGKAVFKPIKTIVRHLEDTFYRVTGKFNYMIEVTKNQSLFVLNNKGKIEEKLSINLTSNDFLLTPKKDINLASSSSSSPIIIDLTKYLDTSKYKTLLRITDDHIKVSNSGTKLPRYIEVDEEFSELLGYYVAEGSSNFALGDELHLAKRILYLLRKKFKVKTCKIYKFPKEKRIEIQERATFIDTYSVQIGTPLIINILKGLCGIGAHNKKVPEVIFNSSKNIQTRFFASLCEGDGRVSSNIELSMSQIGFGTVSYELASGAMFLCKLIGINSRVEKFLSNSPGSEIKYKHFSFLVIISGKDNLEIFLNLLKGFKFSKLKNLKVVSKRSCNEVFYEGIPRRLFDKVVTKSVGKKFKREQLFALKEKLLNFSNKDKPSLIKYGYINKKNGLTKKGKLVFTLCETLQEWNVVEVKKIEKIVKEIPEYVYDFEVPGTQSFVAGLGGVLAHNTGGEPLLRQDSVVEFVKYLRNKINIIPFIETETNGTILPLQSYENLISQWNVSPKLSNNGDPKEKRYKEEVLRYFVNNDKAIFKFVISNEEDLKELFEEYIHKFNLDHRRIYLMPEGSTSEEITKKSKWLVEICKEYVFNFSTRLHIYIWEMATGV